jgi:hypothetical protein
LSTDELNNEQYHGKAYEVLRQRNCRDALVLVRNEIGHVPVSNYFEQNDCRAAHEWKRKLEGEHIREKYAGARADLNDKMETLINIVRDAASAVAPVKQQKKGTNKTPLWTPVLKEVARERAIVTSMYKAAVRYLRTYDEVDWLQAKQYSIQWDIEWRVAKGSLPDTLLRDRTRAALPVITEDMRGRWRHMEKKADAEPLVYIAELSSSLLAPEGMNYEEFVAWVEKVAERQDMLKRVSSLTHRTALFEAGTERKSWNDDFIAGRLKGLVDKIIRKGNGVHSISKVWLQGQNGAYLSSDLQAVKQETERFFEDWMKSRAAPWGSTEERKAASFGNKPPCRPELPEMGWVLENIDDLLQRRKQKVDRSRLEQEEEALERAIASGVTEQIDAASKTVEATRRAGNRFEA